VVLRTGASAFCARRWTRWWGVAVAAERGCCDWYVAGDAKEEDGGGSARLLLCAKVVAAAGFAPAFSGVEVVAGEVGGGGCRGGWKERRKLGLGFWEMKMMTWQNLIG